MEPLPPHLHSRRPAGHHLLRWCGRTDRGKVRKNNEDSFLGLRFGAQEVEYLGKTGEASTANADFVFAVSDGMGGAQAGELASRITVEKVTRLLPRAFKQSAVGLEAGHEEVLEELFDQIHRALMFVGGSYEETAGMGATLTLGWFTNGWLHFAHIGDSRLYYLPGGRRRSGRSARMIRMWAGCSGNGTHQRARGAHASAPQRAAKGARRGAPIR